MLIHQEVNTFLSQFTGLLVVSCRFIRLQSMFMIFIGFMYDCRWCKLGANWLKDWLALHESHFLPFHQFMQTVGVQISRVLEISLLTNYVIKYRQPMAYLFTCTYRYIILIYILFIVVYLIASCDQHNGSCLSLASWIFKFLASLFRCQTMGWYVRIMVAYFIFPIENS